MTTDNEIISILKNEKPYLRQNFGLLSIGLFGSIGSYAKNRPHTGSDVDLLVELTEPSFDLLAGLQIYLENKLQKPVEIVRKRKTMNERLLKHIEKDIQYV